MREQCSFCRNKSEADRDLYRFAFERGHSQSAFTLRQACPERSRRGEGLRANGEDKQAEPKLFVLIVGSCCTQYSPCPLAVQPERNEAKSKAALPIDASTSPLTGSPADLVTKGNLPSLSEDGTLGVRRIFSILGRQLQRKKVKVLPSSKVRMNLIFSRPARPTLSRLNSPLSSTA
jgi:hypothetical protein